MPAISAALNTIARARRDDPLAPATVIAPSHVAAIHLRRQLAEIGPFAGVRFEPLPRLAELLGAPTLARQGRSPLARPIGDYLATQIARQAREDLSDVSDLAGFARVLRQSFTRLRRGGFRPEDVRSRLESGLLGEVTRLYAAFRAETAGFYDEEDLFDAATEAVNHGGSPVIDDLGDIYVLPPGALSAGADALLKALRRAAGSSRVKQLDTPATSPETAFVLAPDPASEVREAAREVLRALEARAGLHEVAVFHGADSAYRGLLAHALDSAGVPISPMPGTPLSETSAGRAVLALAGLPLEDYSRTATFDCLGLAPLRGSLPSPDGPVQPQTSPWLRVAREAGVTKGRQRWSQGLSTLIADREAYLARDDLEDERRGFVGQELQHARSLDGVMRGLIARLEPLRQQRPAAEFIEAFKAVVDAYMDPGAAAMDAVVAQIEQLGTIDKVGGRFDLAGFVAALRANLDAAYYREGRLGEGVLIADYRSAAGLSFRHVVLCGAYEGVFPGSVPQEPLVEDRYWAELRHNGHPFLEDADLRGERARLAAERAVATATERLVWTAPLQAAGAGREHYPAQVMVAAVRALDEGIDSATALRRASGHAWLRRPASPTAALLAGTPVDLTEVRVRSSVAARRERLALPADHTLTPSLRLLASRRAERFGEYDGNVAALAGDGLIPRGSVSPTSLETYALCGFRYFLGHVLRLRPPDEPEDRETMDPAERGSVVHAVLQEFFGRKVADGTMPAAGEPWREHDHAELLAILEAHMDAARERGKTGLDVFAEHERRRLRADLTAFLDQDSIFRAETGAIPTDFEKDLPLDPDAALQMRGFVDRIDWTPDRGRAWVIDYKTGSASAFDGMKADDPLAGGTKLQLPAYLAAATEAESVTPLYWFISAAGKFTRLPFAATAENMARYRSTLDAIVAGVRGGAFPAVSGEENTFYGGWNNCRYCDFNRLCSRRRDDELFAKREDPSLRPWTNVGETARKEPS